MNVVLEIRDLSRGEVDGRFLLVESKDGKENGKTTTQLAPKTAHGASL
jgi:hypothetical protein